MRREAKLRDLTLVFGGILAHNNGGATTADNSGAPYLRDVYERGLHGPANWDGVRRALGSYPLDAVGQHPYVDQGGACTGDHIRAYLGWLHGTIEDYEGRGSVKPLYVTEVAWAPRWSRRTRRPPTSPRSMTPARKRPMSRRACGSSC